MKCCHSALLETQQQADGCCRGKAGRTAVLLWHSSAQRAHRATRESQEVQGSALSSHKTALCDAHLHCFALSKCWHVGSRKSGLTDFHFWRLLHVNSTFGAKPSHCKHSLHLKGRVCVLTWCKLTPLIWNQWKFNSWHQLTICLTLCIVCVLCQDARILFSHLAKLDKVMKVKINFEQLLVNTRTMNPQDSCSKTV